MKSFHCNHRQPTYTCVLDRLFFQGKKHPDGEALQGPGNSSDNIDVLSVPAQELDICLDVFRPMFQGYSWWREVLSHPSGWMVWNALGGSVLSGWPLAVQEFPGNGLSSKPPRDSISLTKMESRVSTIPKR